MANRGSDFMPWIKTQTWAKLEPKMKDVLKHVEGKKVGMVGFCWGGWVIAQTSAMSDAVKCGVIPHPSIHLEENAFGGKNTDLASKVRCPLLIMPAGNDP